MSCSENSLAAGYRLYLMCSEVSCGFWSDLSQPQFSSGGLFDPYNPVTSEKGNSRVTRHNEFSSRASCLSVRCTCLPHSGRRNSEKRRSCTSQVVSVAVSPDLRSSHLQFPV